MKGRVRIMFIVKSDVTVAGAGLAGLCAAVAASREGLKVSLVGNRSVLGGNSSSEVRMWTRGATGAGNLFAEEMGIIGEVKLRNLYTNLDCNVVLWDEVLYDLVTREKNISLFLDTNITDVEMKEKGTISKLIGFQLGSEKHYEFESSVFIDCTGDGTVGFLSGAKFRFGRESKNEFEEPFAADNADSYTLCSSIYFQTKKVNHKVKFLPPTYAYTKEQIEKLLNHGGRIVDEKRNGCDYWWLEYGGVKDIISDNPEITCELKKIVMGVWDYVKNSGKFDSDNLTLEWIGNVAGKRESRRLIGDYILNQNDAINHRCFEDSVCYGGWFFDLHPPLGIYSSEEFCEQISVPLYDIPLRCLYSQNINNLLFAGRDISVTHAALASTRIMNTCALMGQAVGTAAGFCVANNKSPRQVNKDHIIELRQELIKNDMFILNCKNEDILDKARYADVIASSVRKLQNTVPERKECLKDDTFLIVPWRKDANRFELLMDSEKDTILEFDVYRTIYPESFKPGIQLAHREISIIKQRQGWIGIELNDIDYEGFLYILLHKNNNVNIYISASSCTGTLIGRNDSRLYYNPCINVFPEDGFYDSINVINGYNRPYSLPNLWISDRMRDFENEWLILKWKQAVDVNEIRLYFNIDLNKELTSSRSEVWAEHHNYVARDGMPPQLVKDYSVYGFVDDKWVKFLEIRDNWRRMAVHSLNKVHTNMIKIEFEGTYGSQFIEVFEVRVY
jgi:hypothetical protein